MPNIRVDNFGGMAPRISNRLLPDTFASEATNCKLFSGELRGWNMPKLVVTFSEAFTPLKAFRIPNSPSDFWMAFEYANTNIVSGPLVNDAYDRYYWTAGSNDVPRYNTTTRILASSSSYTLGIPAPTLTPTLTPTGGTGDTVTRAYVFTYISDLGEESAPSDPITASGASDATWTFAALGTDISTDMPSSSSKPMTVGTAVKRIYRTITSTSGQTTFFFVADIAINTATYADTSSDEDIAFNSLLQSSGWNTPPTDLEGIVAHPNGFLVGFSGRDIYFSEPYRPHAWPAKYVVSTDHAIKGLGIVGNTVGILTESTPYTSSGGHPSAMTLTKSTSVEPCLSSRGIVTLQNGIYYPSHNGLAFLTASGSLVITRNVLTKEEWQNNYDPENLVATRYGTRYLAFKDAHNGLIFDPQEERAAIVDIARTDDISDVFTDVFSGAVYLLAGDNIYEWEPTDITTPISYSWTSKDFEFAQPVNMGAGMVKLDDSDFSLDPDLVTDAQTVNTTILATAPTRSLGAINTRPVNDVRQGVSYVSALHVTNQYQSGTIAGNDLIDVAYLQSLTASTVVSVWADEVKVFSHAVDKNTIFRLPAGFKAHIWRFNITSNVDVFSIALSPTARGLNRS